MWLSDWTTKAISEIKDEGPNNITKDVCIILIAQEILKILKAVDKDQIYVKQIYLSPEVIQIKAMLQLAKKKKKKKERKETKKTAKVPDAYQSASISMLII